MKGRKMLSSDTDWIWTRQLGDNNGWIFLEVETCWT